MIDGDYERKLGTLVLDAADTIVWLDLPTRVWLPRLIRRRPRGSRAARSSGTATARPGATAFWGRESLFGYALTQQPRRRREWPARLAGHPVVRLRTPDEVRRWIAS